MADAQAAAARGSLLKGNLKHNPYKTKFNFSFLFFHHLCFPFKLSQLCLWYQHPPIFQARYLQVIFGFSNTLMSYIQLVTFKFCSVLSIPLSSQCHCSNPSRYLSHSDCCHTLVPSLAQLPPLFHRCCCFPGFSPWLLSPLTLQACPRWSYPLIDLYWNTYDSKILSPAPVLSEF